jgi:hypothetical protein
MSKIPSKLTWIVSHSAPRRSICKDAAAPSRVVSFLRRNGHVEEIVAPWGQNWDGNKLSSIRKKVLRTGIYRNNVLVQNENDNCPGSLDEVMNAAADAHGVTSEQLRNPPDRSARYARARGYAIHLFREKGLSTTQIAVTLNYTNHSAVRHWLKKSFLKVCPGVKG